MLTATDAAESLLKIADVAQRLNVSRSTAYALLDVDDGIPTVQVGRCRRVRREDLEEFIERNRYCGTD